MYIHYKNMITILLAIIFMMYFSSFVEGLFKVIEDTRNDTRVPYVSPYKKMYTDDITIFKQIAHFVEDLGNAFKDQHKPLKLYARLIERTGFTHSKVIRKHIEIFRNFCAVNRECIMEQNHNKLALHNIEYSETAHINMYTIFNMADKDTSNIIWAHLIKISELVDNTKFNNLPIAIVNELKDGRQSNQSSDNSGYGSLLNAGLGMLMSQFKNPTPNYDSKDNPETGLEAFLSNIGDAIQDGDSIKDVLKNNIGGLGGGDGMGGGMGGGIGDILQNLELGDLLKELNLAEILGNLAAGEPVNLDVDKIKGAAKNMLSSIKGKIGDNEQFSAMIDKVDTMVDGVGDENAPAINPMELIGSIMDMKNDMDAKAKKSTE